jgi:hypothetical protein
MEEVCLSPDSASVHTTVNVNLVREPTYEPAHNIVSLVIECRNSIGLVGLVRRIFFVSWFVLSLVKSTLLSFFSVSWFGWLVLVLLDVFFFCFLVCVVIG